eukprot:TRINITY_DN40369_c0_g1_i1.p1 TRINITY_DN40369_c0_g1~~TRINITY_DN40369_c0_g1_i1.p1  ORF type:complete len:1024 (+),score=149.68 TRINITY_DN40369_c0_g1_i1:102-3074(+)
MVTRNALPDSNTSRWSGRALLDMTEALLAFVADNVCCVRRSRRNSEGSVSVRPVRSVQLQVTPEGAATAPEEHQIVPTCSQDETEDIDFVDIDKEVPADRSLDSDETSSEDELEEEPPLHLDCRPRCAVSVEAHGEWNPRIAVYVRPSSVKTDVQCENLRTMLEACPLFARVSADSLDALVEAMPVVTVQAGEQIIQQGEQGDELFVVLNGAVACFEEGGRRSQGNILEEPTADPRGRFVRSVGAGLVFGQLAMLWRKPRTLSVYAETTCELGKLQREVYTELVVRRELTERSRREQVLRKAPVLETMNDEQLAKVADALDLVKYQDGQTIIKQGETGDDFFVVLTGECACTVETGGIRGAKDVQEHRRYGPGQLFGERALLERTVRAATITAITQVEALRLGRRKFERLLGPLEQLQRIQYLADPRKSVADFYKPGDRRGPLGSCGGDPEQREDCCTKWFAVYRPTSRHAIAKMLSGHAVGKGLNVKGKSAKKNHLSGYVPFLQISDNKHKAMIDKPQADSRLKIFFQSDEARTRALLTLKQIAAEAIALESDSDSFEEDDGIYQDNSYIVEDGGVYGLEVPEPIFYEAYLTRPDITCQVGWDTGRKSEPGFMDMNLCCVRENKQPQVVLYQADLENAMNPHGLLIAYAEDKVKPVVSDFDTFTVGSTNMSYAPLPEDQAKLAKWVLEQTQEIMEGPCNESWTSLWLEVLRKAKSHGQHPVVPKYGYGDPVSNRLISEVMQSTASTGAIRHGAECFNFTFPQELDDEYLVVWNEYDDKPWRYISEKELRSFLLARAEENFSFPLNPVWPIRDEGWYDVFQALRCSPSAAPNLRSWFPPESGIMQTIERMHLDNPTSFKDNSGGSKNSRARKSRMSTFMGNFIDDEDKSNHLNKVRMLMEYESNEFDDPGDMTMKAVASESRKFPRRSRLAKPRNSTPLSHNARVTLLHSRDSADPRRFQDLREKLLSEREALSPGRQPLSARVTQNLTG